ncbi:MAG: response regulator transcription factor [Blautia sp.]|jgi:two-component system alkaline phosphatase synthesis response regulator PhoP
MIYCVEDERNIRELIVYTLESSGFAAKGFENGEALYESLRQETPQLILLDIMLPGEDGMSILKRLKSDLQTGEIPVILVTAKGAEYDKVLGLDMGADDYIVKPFGMMELVARVKALLRRSQKSKDTQDYVLGDLRMQVDRHVVTVQGEAVSLTFKEFELLKYMLENPGIVLSRDQILARIWGYEFAGETRTVDVHIRTLRKKLGPCQDLIETIRGVGYRMGG